MCALDITRMDILSVTAALCIAKPLFTILAMVQQIAASDTLQRRGRP